MKCSRCSENVKPVFVCDIDGTLAEYHHTLSRFMSMYWNFPIPAVYWDGTGEFSDWLGLTKEQYREAKLAYRQGGYKRYAPVFPGAEGLLLRARTLGCETWIATHRPWKRLDAVDPDTRFWLERNGLVYDHLLYSDSKLDDLVERVDPDRVVMVLDDLVEVLRTGLSYWAVSVLRMIARPHNEGENEFPVIHNLAVAGNELNAAVNEWRAKHGD